MTIQRKKISKATKPKRATARQSRSTQTKSEPLKALPQPEPGPNPECGEPGGGRGRVDIIGRPLKQPAHIDPDLTEGHPGYEESGDSGLPVAQRLSGNRTAVPRKTKRK